MYPPRPALAFVALLAATSFAPAAAQNSESPPTRKTLSRAELRACIQREEELGRRSDDLLVAMEANERSIARLSAEALELSRVLRGLDPGDEAAVDAYNRRNDARNAAVDAHNKHTEALNATVAELQGAEADFLASCASRPFLKVDEAAVMKELGLTERRAAREKRQGPNRPAGKTQA